MSQSDHQATEIDFFVSRAGADAGTADLIGRILEETGRRVLLQQWDFANRSFMERMHSALASSARVIALLSDDYLRSKHSTAEWLSVLAHDPLNEKGRLIVLRVGECASVGLLSQIAYVDLVPVLNDRGALKQIVLESIREDRRIGAPALPHVRQPKQVLHPKFDDGVLSIERTDDLARVESWFWGQPRKDTACAALVGLGGVGKSALARSYAWRHRDRYRGLWWIHAETVDEIMAGLIGFGEYFIPGVGELANRRQAVQLVLDFIEQNSKQPWLFVFDNLPDPGVLHGFSPRTGAHVVVTSRWRDWYGQACEVMVDALGEAAAIEFLLRRTGRDDTAGAKRLAASLGCLPLALAHAGAYCKSTQMSFDDYLAHHAVLMRKVPKAAGQSLSVYATFNLAIDRAADGLAEAFRLAALLAHFSPDRIPLSLIVDEVMSPIDRGEAVAALSEVSLIALEAADASPVVSMHPLVQEVMRARLQETGESPRVVALAIALANLAFPDEKDQSIDVEIWPVCALLMPHALAAIESASELQDSPPALPDLLNKIGLYLLRRGEPGGAESHLVDALRYESNMPVASPARLSRALNNLGLAQHALGKLADAETSYRRAISISETADPQTNAEAQATRLNNLALLLNDALRHGEAEEMLRTALAINEASYGRQHPVIAMNLNNLGLVLLDVGRTSEAESAIKEAISTWQQGLGADHPAAGRGLDNLARVLWSSGRREDAREVNRQALAILEAWLPSGHEWLGEARMGPEASWRQRCARHQPKQ